MNAFRATFLALGSKGVRVNRYAVSVILVLLGFCWVGAVAGPPKPLVVEVNCDEGDDLASVIREASVWGQGGFQCGPPFAPLRSRPTRSDCEVVVARPVEIGVRGSCEGPIRISGFDLTLRGLEEGATVSVDFSSSQEPGPFAAIAVDRGSDVLIENMAVSVVGSGLILDVSHSNLTARESSFMGPIGGWLLSRSSRIVTQRCEMDVASLGSIWQSSEVVLEDSVVADTRITVDGSRLWLKNSGTGLTVMSYSSRLVVEGGTDLLQISGQGSDVSLLGGTVSVISLSDGSFFTQTGGKVSGIVLLSSSRAKASGGTVATVDLRDFSQAALGPFNAIESLTCDTTSDASCVGSNPNIGSSTCSSCVVPPN